MDQVADEVWRSYSNVETALRRRDAATALLQAARQSYIAAVEAYGFGVRSLLDVTEAQRVLAQARSADVAARTAVLHALADLAFSTGDFVPAGGCKGNPCDATLNPSSRGDCGLMAGIPSSGFIVLPPST